MSRRGGRATNECRVRPCPRCGGIGHVSKPVDCTDKSEGVAFVQMTCPACGGARFDRRRLRIESLRNAGGKHSREDICGILALQKRRCIYCNKKFTQNKVLPTKDHLLPVVHGGGNSSLNIVMACRKCNSRRCNIPFRTYCKLLSRTQNRRILAHLTRRLLAVDFDHLCVEEFSSFDMGLELHEPRHPRYLDIRSISAIADRNAAKNRLLPRTGSLIRTFIATYGLRTLQTLVDCLRQHRCNREASQ